MTQPQNGVYFTEIANYSGITPKSHHSSVVDTPDDCPFSILSYHNQNNDIVGYGASLNTVGGTRHAYVILGKENLKPFIDNANQLAMLANICYIGGTPTSGQIEMIMGSKWKGLGMMWKEALTDPGYYAYLANIAGVSVINLPNKIGNINFAAEPLKHMRNPNRYVPVSLLEDVINTTKGIPDPRGTSATMHYKTLIRNGTTYQLEVLYESKTNTIWHFKYTYK